jgi:uncharacterized protein
MEIDWDHFTPWLSLGGGVLIGIAAALFVLLAGRIMGVSGIVGGLLSPRRNDLAWRLTFVAGLLTAPLGLGYLRLVPAPRIETGWTALIVAGLLVGFGTRLGSGCTSGHGICGIARLSSRSMVATVLFLLSGIATAVITRHLVESGGAL